jgi:hypothetical protein
MQIENVFSVLSRHGSLLFWIISVYLFFMLLGMLFHKRLPRFLATFIRVSDEQKKAQAEKMFGRFRQPVKDGNPYVTAKCMLIVFGLNTLGTVQNIVLSALLLPLVLQLGFVALQQGISVSKTKGSSLFSIVSYYFVGGLEWVTYPVANCTGILFIVTQISSLFNHKKLALLQGLGEVLSLLIPIVILLFIQAILEVLYVRKVLLRGGTGIPLQPY